jgi:hypothetical protein
MSSNRTASDVSGPVGAELLPSSVPTRVGRLLDRLTERGGVPLALEHGDHVVGADGAGVEGGDDDPQDVLPSGSGPCAGPTFSPPGEGDQRPVAAPERMGRSSGTLPGRRIDGVEVAVLAAAVEDAVLDPQVSLDVVGLEVVALWAGSIDPSGGSGDGVDSVDPASDKELHRISAGSGMSDVGIGEAFPPPPERLACGRV